MRKPIRALTGAVTVVATVAIVATAVAMFRGSWQDTVPLTVLSQRAGLMMNPGAKVELLGVQVGRVASIEQRPDGQAVLHLAMDRDALHQIPANAAVNITSTTVFGAKFVDFVAPTNPAPQSLAPGAVLDAGHVTVEINTVFERLTQVLDRIDPAKLNATLGAIAAAFRGRGDQFGRTLTDFDHYLATLEPSLPNLSHELQALPTVAAAYGDAAPDLVTTARNAALLSDTIVDQQRNLDAFLVSTTGLADIGNDVLSTNRQPLADTVHLLLSTTDLTSEYAPALRCGLQALVHLTHGVPLELPGVVTSTGFVLGRERYRYPENLPKVAATGGPHCADMGLPAVPMEFRPPILVMDDGADPTQYGNQGILLNSDGLKQLLFGPLDGPPRNSAQIGMPG